ncbi:hypothetical protein C3L33_23147, partial [Rhododendron williamsianum]
MLDSLSFCLLAEEKMLLAMHWRNVLEKSLFITGVIQSLCGFRSLFLFQTAAIGLGDHLEKLIPLQLQVTLEEEKPQTARLWNSFVPNRINFDDDDFLCFDLFWVKSISMKTQVLLKEERLVIMAEIVVEPFVSFVVERLGNLLIQEYRLLHGVRAQVEQMQKELSRMQCFLKAADARRGEGDELVSNCISEIRELSLDAEDVIATFAIKVALMRRGKIFSESIARHEIKHRNDGVREKNGQALWGPAVGHCGIRRSSRYKTHTRYSGRVKFYRLHDLVRDLCLLKAQEENFVKVVRMGKDLATTSSSLSSSITIRRLGVYCKANRNVGDNRRRGHVKALRKDETCNLHHVRSCQFYSFGNTLEDSDWQHVKSIFKGFKLLTFLDLEKTKFHGSKNKGSEFLKGKKLPKAIGNLIHLRYLSIRDSEITSLPSSIGNLQFLETLDLRYARHKYGVKITNIPNVLWRLEQLRHLYLPGWDICCVPSGVKLRLDGLSKLETLHGFNTKHVMLEAFPRSRIFENLELLCTT